MSASGSIASLDDLLPECRRECRYTGSYYDTRSVRRCPHGRIWRCDLVRPHYDHWVRVRPWLRPFLYRRAIRALALRETA